MSIRRTVTLGEAAQITWDVVVVGAGPAGSTLARELASRDHAVLLVDKAGFPRGKVCGCCLNGLALSVLERVGLSGLLRRCSATPLDTVQINAGRATAQLSLPKGAVLSRKVLDAALLRQAIEDGVIFLPEVRATSAGLEGHLRKVTLTGAQLAPTLVRSKILVIADGLSGSSLRNDSEFTTHVQSGSRIGVGQVFADAPKAYHRGRIYLAVGEQGYVGLVRLEDDQLDVAAALCPKRIHRRRDVGRIIQSLIQRSGWPVPEGLLDARWHGAPALTRYRTPVAAERIFLLGDTARYVEPFTGEGMAWALASAEALAPLVSRGAQQWSSRLANQWKILHRSLFASRQRLCRGIARFLRWPTAVEWTLPLLRRFPWLAAPFLRHLNSHLPGKERDQ